MRSDPIGARKLWSNPAAARICGIQAMSWRTVVSLALEDEATARATYINLKRCAPALAKEETTDTLSKLAQTPAYIDQTDTLQNKLQAVVTSP